MKRIILHWSGGSHNATKTDKKHYHRIVDGTGNIHAGIHPIKANERPQKGHYAAHTLNCNTGSIGVAMACMRGAKEHPFNVGSHPMTDRQLAVFVKLVAQLATDYSIPITRQTVLTHAEVQPTLGITQRGKWDINWLVGWKKPLKPVEAGDLLRAVIKENMGPKPKVADPRPDLPATAPNWLSRLLERLFAFFKLGDDK